MLVEHRIVDRWAKVTGQRLLDWYSVLMTPVLAGLGATADWRAVFDDVMARRP